MKIFTITGNQRLSRESPLHGDLAMRCGQKPSFMDAKKAPFLKKISAALLALTVGNSMTAASAGTTTADFLTWERKAQESFLQIALNMTGVIASQNKPKVAECIDDWYFKNDATKAKRNQEILDFMPDFSEFSPTVVVLAIVNDVCGKF